MLRDNIQGITTPAIRRLCRRGGVKRIAGRVYEEVRGVLKVFLENVLRDTVTYTDHARRKTVTIQDVLYALKRQGRTLYSSATEETKTSLHAKTAKPAKKKSKKKPAVQSNDSGDDSGAYEDDAQDSQPKQAKKAKPQPAKTAGANRAPRLFPNSNNAVAGA